MSRVQRDAYHAARLVQNELTRIAAKRERRISQANADFQLELRQAVADADLPVVKLVAQVLREDSSQLHLSQSLETVLADETEITWSDDEHERQTEPPPLPPRAPSTLPGSAELAPSSMPAPDGNAAWGMPAVPPAPRTPSAPALAGALDVPVIEQARDDVVIDGEFEEAEPAEGEVVVAGYRYRYPEAGENAAQLPSGEVVAANEAGQPIRVGASP